MALEVCVKGLPPRVDEDTVRDFFSRVGQVEAVSVNSDTANVVFANEEDMQEALRLNGMPFEDGAPISVSRGGAGVGEERDVPAAEGSRADNTSRNKANRDEFKVAVRKLPPNITEEDLRNLFSPCGTIADFHLHRTKEYAFVGFENKEACDAALMLNDHEINGQPVQVEMKLTRTSRTEGRVVVKNLPADATEDSIRTFFSNCGNITDVFHNSKKQFAFLAFDRPDAAQRAIDRTGEDIGGSTIKVEQRDAQQKCFKCNQMGHIAAQCRSSAILCRECGKPGHVARDCRSVRGRGAGFGGGGFRRNDRGDRDDRRRPRSRSRSASVDRDRRRRRRSSSPRRRHSRSPRRHSRHHSRSPSRSRRY